MPQTLNPKQMAILTFLQGPFREKFPGFELLRVWELGASGTIIKFQGVGGAWEFRGAWASGP